MTDSFDRRNAPLLVSMPRAALAGIHRPSARRLDLLRYHDGLSRGVVAGQAVPPRGPAAQAGFARAMVQLWS